MAAKRDTVLYLQVMIFEAKSRLLNIVSCDSSIYNLEADFGGRWSLCLLPHWRSPSLSRLCVFTNVLLESWEELPQRLSNNHKSLITALKPACSLFFISPPWYFSIVVQINFSIIQFWSSLLFLKPPVIAFL